MHPGARVPRPRSPRAILGAVALLCAVFAAPHCASAASEPVVFPSLAVGKTVYRDVRIKSRDDRSVFFTYAGGIGSARLRDLPPEAQARLGYDPLTAPPEPAPPTPKAVPPMLARRAPVSDNFASSNQRLDRLFLSFDSVANLAPRLSLQDDYTRLDLTVKDQGRRPSCSVYAIVSALEFQFFQLHGRAEDFSEEYLIWATRRSLGLVGRDGLPIRNTRGEPVTDAGYTLPSVVGALATYGVALEEEMPGDNTRSLDEIPTPDRTLIDFSRQRRAVFIAQIPGRETEAILNNVVHALNAGLPVPAGIDWPAEATSRHGLLDAQETIPNASHAVTFVGYECPTCRPEDAVFIFKNSYGTAWGESGYGRATWRYLTRHLREAYVLDVRALDAGR